MGYTSEWQLLVVGPRIEEFKAYLDEQADRNPLPPEWDWNPFEFIRDHQEDCPIENGVFFSHPWTKCYDPWDSVMNEILEVARDMQLDACYGRLGDAMGDYEFDGGEDYMITYSRKLIKPWKEANND